MRVGRASKREDGSEMRVIDLEHARDGIVITLDRATFFIEHKDGHLVIALRGNGEVVVHR